MPTRGEVGFDGVRVTQVPPERRRVAVMFESYALYPHLSVFDNVAFPLRAPGAARMSAGAIAERVRELLRFVELPTSRGGARRSCRAASASASR
jgi:ABC-type Fe3+/spermidine/putrescine transport system ATPase subunit